MILIGSSNLSAQKHFNNWYFGDKAGITFNTATGEPEALIDGVMDTNEGCSVLSDSNGALLFYTDGRTVWNKFHQVMKNGTGLPGHSSSTQSALIVPKPGSEYIYFIFTNDASENQFAYGFNYSIVDLNLENGLGAVTQKNVHLLNNECERLAAVTHSNGRDIWVVIQDIDKQIFAAYLLTDKGLDIIPVNSPTKIAIQQSQAGVLKFSPDGKKLVCTHYKIGNILLYDFDKNNGLISNEVSILVDTKLNPEIYGAEFSDNGQFLYISSNLSLFQFDISSNNKNTIQNSRQIIFSPKLNNHLWAMEMGPNKKIYIATQKAFLSVIHEPNKAGLACNLKIDDVDLLGRKSIYGLPDIIKNYVRSIVTNDSLTACQGDSVFFNPPYIEGAQYEWSGPEGFTSTAQNPILISPDVKMGGEYKYIIKKAGAFISSGSVHVKILPRRKILFSDLKDIMVCQDSLELSAVEFPVGCDISWTGINSKENTVIIRKSGKYSVYIVNENGCRDSAAINVRIKESPKLQIIGKNSLCKDDIIILSANYDFPEYFWSTGDTTKEISVNKKGYYYLLSTDSNGCKDSTGKFISSFGSSIIFSDKLNNYGLVKSGNLAEFTFTIENKELQDVTIQEIYIKNNPLHFDLVHPVLPFMINSKGKINITVNFIPKFETNFADSLVIVYSEPCNITEYVKLTARSEGEILVDFWLPDTTAGIGADNFLLPVNVRLRDSSNHSFKTNITARIKFLRNLYNVDNLTFGQYSVEKLKDSAAFNIEFNDVIISDELNKISDFTGKILFTNEGFTKVRIESLEFSTPYLIPNAKDGSIKTNEICNPDLKGIKIREGTFLSLKYDRIQGNSAIAYCGSAGNYKFSIFTIAGEMLYSTNWQTDSKTEKHFELSEIITNSGLYFIVLNSVDGIDLQKVTLIK